MTHPAQARTSAKSGAGVKESAYLGAERFLGVSGHNLLLIGLAVCAAGLVFGLTTAFWALLHVPAGSRVIVEVYGFDILSARCHLMSVRRLIDKAPEFYTGAQADYVVAAEDVFGPYLRSPGTYPRESAAYLRLFGDMALVRTINESGNVSGPELRIYRVTRPSTDVPEAAGARGGNDDG